ncbi:MAG: hypothetical protein ACXWJD_03735 [Burkholderiaceae bacterium]
MRLSRLIFISAMLLSSSAMALDASSLKLKVYAVMASTSALCTSPVTIFSSATPTEVDFLTTPTLGSGSLPDGTYNCIIIQMSDNIKFKPTTTSGSCSSLTEYTNDVCRSDNGGTTRAPDAGGAATACNGTDPGTPVPDVVYLYLTTNALAGTGGQTFLQPVNANSANGLHLTAPLVISGSAQSKFVVNAAGAVDGTQATCGMNPPTFGFVKL